jgi:hypothetical protein
VIGDTIEDIDKRRQLAHRQAVAHASFPRFLELNDVQIPLFKLKELEDLGKPKLKQRCLDLRDIVDRSGCLFFENHHHLKLNAAQGEDVLCDWYLSVQVTIAAALGMSELNFTAFGAPHLEGSLPQPMAHSQQRQQRQSPPQMSHEEYEHNMAMMQRQMYEQQQMQQAQPQVQVRPTSQGMHEGVPASRFDDAARIRTKNLGSNNIFG